MLKIIDQGDLRGHGHRKDFSGGALGDFSKIFLRVAKNGKICFFHLETKKTIFFAKIFEIQGRPRLTPLPMPMYVDATWLKSITHNENPNRPTRLGQA